MRIDNSMAQISAKIGGMGGAAPVAQNPQNPAGIAITGKSFAQIYEEQLKKSNDLTFSKHAMQRMTEREMELSGPDLEKLSGAVKAAGEKGVNDTLVLMGNMAFIVNVPGNVVVTAMKDSDIQGNVFTKIDGAVIV